MKAVYIFAVLLAVATYVSAQNNIDENGQCNKNEDCVKNLQCVDNRCGCPHGHKIETTSTPSGSSLTSVKECVSVVGSRCVESEECARHLEHSKCHEGTCVCNSDDGCVDGASTTFVSMTTIGLLLFIVLKVW